MIAPSGYEAVPKIEKAFRKILANRMNLSEEESNAQTLKAVAHALSSHGDLYAFSIQDGLISIPSDTLYYWEDEPDLWFLFADTHSWVVSLKNLHTLMNDAPRIMSGSGDQFPDNDYLIYFGWIIKNEGLLKYPEILKPLEGYHIVFEAKNYDKLVEDFDQSVLERLENTTPNITGPAEQVAKFIEWAQTFGTDNKATKRESEEWGKIRGIGRDRMREIRRDHAPAHWHFGSKK